MTPDTPSLNTSRYHGSCKWSRIITKFFCLISKLTLSVTKNDTSTVPPDYHPDEQSSPNRSSIVLLNIWSTVRVANHSTGRPDLPTAQPINRYIDHPSEQPIHLPTNRTDRLNDKSRLIDWIIYRPTDRLIDRPTDTAVVWLINRWTEWPTNLLQDQKMNQIIIRTPW